MIEPETTKLFINIIKDCKLFIDIGAGSGYYTNLASKNMSSGKIIAIEPFKSDFSKLNKIYNKNVEIVKYNICVGDYCGKITLFTGTTPSVLEKLKKLRPKLTNSKKEVDIKTIDSIVSRNETPDIIKIDVEGYELNVLEGSISTIKDKNIKIIVEIHDEFINANNQSPEDIYDFMSAMGYKHKLIEMGKKLNLGRYLFYR